jgi:hypothetical protein
MSKKEYEEKDLLNETVRIESIMHAVKRKKFSVRYIFGKNEIKRIHDLHFSVLSWYHPYCLAGEFRKPVEVLTGFFGSAPTTYLIYRNLTAVWAFTWDTHHILFFKSKRGVTIQVDAGFPSDRMEEFYLDLLEVLKAKGESNG